MKGIAAALVTAALVTVGVAGAADFRTVQVGAVGVDVPAGWARVAAADDRPGGDARTLLVVGTRGVQARDSRCQVTSYRVPADGAAVVVLAWAGPAVSVIPRDPAVLQALRLRSDYFDCWDGRGGAAQISVKGRAYQVNVLVGERASRATAAEALAVGRSFAAAGD